MVITAAALTGADSASLSALITAIGGAAVAIIGAIVAAVVALRRGQNRTHDAVNHFQEVTRDDLAALRKELAEVREKEARKDADTLERERARADAPPPTNLVDANGDEVHTEKPAPVVLADVAPAAIQTLTAATPPPPEKGRL